MADLDLRRGVTGGAIVSVMMAATSISWAADQPRASMEVLTVCLATTLLAVGVVRTIQTNASPVTAVDPYAGFWVRALAMALDYIPLYVVGILLALIGLGAVAVPILLGLAIAYFVGQWAFRGQTLGMQLLGLRVMREDGGKVTVVVAFQRFLGLCLAFACFFLGVVWVAFDANKRGWADFLGGTVVVRTGAR
jgi:uncharacterized RDD family membrane protein YckC